MIILNYFMEYINNLHISVKVWDKQMECFSHKEKEYEYHCHDFRVSVKSLTFSLS